ncbi:MAG: hypothetical protein L6R42_009803, partial [Xanthoria sp. 1 TBL-2021]
AAGDEVIYVPDQANRQLDEALAKPFGQSGLGSTGTYREKSKRIENLVARKTYRDYVKEQTKVDRDDSDQTEMVAFMGFDTVEELGILNGSPEDFRYILSVAHDALKIENFWEEKIVE